VAQSYKLIILDLDGTLIDSLEDLTDAANAMRRSFDLPPLSVPEVKLLVGEGAQRLVERALPGLTPDEVARGLRLFLRYNYDHIADRTFFYPGVRETLEKLADAGIILCVASNKSEAHCREILRLLQSEQLFAGILGADSVTERKPSPAPLLHLMEQFGCSTEETVMVGDSINDMKAGNSAKVFTIGCSYGYGAAGELKLANCIVSSFPQILKTLEMQ
jgi:phosphoglycolate phosphatase